MDDDQSIWNELSIMREQIDNLYNSMFSKDPFFNNTQLIKTGENTTLKLNNYKKPITNIHETDNELIVELEIPGMHKEDIDVQINNNSIEIRAEQKQEQTAEDEKKHTKTYETSYTGFYRSFNLPRNVNSQGAQAEYENGVLKIKMPKIELKENKTKHLEIK